MKTTTIEIPVELKERLQRLKTHPRQAYHEVIVDALARIQVVHPLERSAGGDPLVSKHRKVIAALARAHGLRNLRVFGSRARGDARPDSDLDLLFDLEPGRTLFDVMAFQGRIEPIVGVPVHLTELEGMRESIRERVLADMRPL